MAATQPSESAPAARSPRTNRWTIGNYFLVILGGFGLLTVYVNFKHGGLDQHGSIGSFQEQHFGNFRSSERSKKDAQVEGGWQPFKSEDNAVTKSEGKVPNEQDTAVAQHNLAGLSCDAYGGPAAEVAKEMVYWEDIPSDNTFKSPFFNKKETQYLSFESDHGGWNNIRMAMETVMTIALAMGRTLVLPPEQGMYLLHKDKADDGATQRKHFSYYHFFHMESIAQEHQGLEVITMKEFLEREGVTGRLRNLETGQIQFPPKNRTDYDGAVNQAIEKQLEPYLVSVSKVPAWNPDECLAAFPSTTDPKDIESLEQMFEKVRTARNGGFPIFDDYVGKPTPVDGDALERLKENWAERKKLCIYDFDLQSAKLVHFTHGDEGGARLLVHFYAFLFFEDWKQDLWMKRFVRDHVRYIDEIQCAAARVVEALRKRARSRHPTTNPKGDFDAFHIRRGDFQYKVTRFEADKILRMSQKELTQNATVYIATDERNKAFFKPLMEVYDVVFLDDFLDVLKGVNSNYYGMMDQLIASRSRIFFGCWFSTFTGYINRIRGYHSNREKSWKGYEDGLIPSYYYALEDRKYHMQEFYPVKKQFYAREFPASWRGIDKGIGELQHLTINQK